ncbi:MAG: purine-nucleoside phosphorylase [Bacteroidota bacterium]|nr:purine-nucleoside phosphorylase [Bacteroidota bacterium]
MDKSVRFIKSKTKFRPKIAVILGSGLGDFAETLSDKKIIGTSSIPNYPRSTVVGHKGKIIFGKLGKIQLMVFQGRVHYYETGSIETILYPIRIAHALGIKILLVTNAAGGVNSTFKPGDIMLIEDQINLTFENPLKGIAPPIHHTQLYEPSLQNLIRNVAKKKKIALRSGIYCGIKGPSYETAAEIKMIRNFGADAVGMSTVNEVSLAVSLGIKVAGLSCITNLSTGILNQKLSHQEVTEVANMVKHVFSELIAGFIQKIGKVYLLTFQ